MARSLRSKLHLPGAASPTMIIPSGTQIQVDGHGQLSIRTPGNLVIQNSGAYAVLESTSGSIRIEPNVQVEAVTIKCADTCFVQGSLTAWHVIAKSLQLDGEAEAHVMMQETEELHVGKDARLVGNFSSEKELFLLFSRFARQVKSLPFSFEEEPRRVEIEEDGEGDSRVEARTGPPDIVDAEPSDDEVGESMEGARDDELPEPLFFARVLLEREAEKTTYGPGSRRIIAELVKLLREPDFETLRHTRKTLFSRVKDPSDDFERARQLVASHFRSR